MKKVLFLHHLESLLNAESIRSWLNNVNCFAELTLWFGFVWLDLRKPVFEKGLHYGRSSHSFSDAPAPFHPFEFCHIRVCYLAPIEPNDQRAPYSWMTIWWFRHDHFVLLLRCLLLLTSAVATTPACGELARPMSSITSCTSLSWASSNSLLNRVSLFVIMLPERTWLGLKNNSCYTLVFHNQTRVDVTATVT